MGACCCFFISTLIDIIFAIITYRWNYSILSSPAIHIPKWIYRQNQWNGFLYIVLFHHCWIKMLMKSYCSAKSYLLYELPIEIHLRLAAIKYNLNCFNIWSLCLLQLRTIAVNANLREVFSTTQSTLNVLSFWSCVPERKRKFPFCSIWMSWIFALVWPAIWSHHSKN